MLFGSKVINDPFDRGVEQLDDQNENQRGDHEPGAYGVDRKNDRQWHQQECENQVLPERWFVLEGGRETVDRIPNRGQEVSKTTPFDFGRLTGCGHSPQYADVFDGGKLEICDRLDPQAGDHEASNVGKWLRRALRFMPIAAQATSMTASR